MIAHNRPYLGTEEIEAVAAVIQSGHLSQNTQVELFENELCSFLGLPSGHAVALSSGTAALYLALWALEAEGKTVAIPTYTCSALAHAIHMANAIPSFLDVATDSPNVDIDTANNRDADILIVPYMYGIPTPIRQYSGIIIEDCAQALGARINGQPVATIGDIGVLSFYATKLLTTGQGGMVISPNRGLIDAIRDYRVFDCRYDGKFRFNFQMTDIQAAMGRIQLGKLSEMIAKRKEILERYRDASTFPLLTAADQTVEPAYYRAVLRVPQHEAPRLIGRFRQAGIKAIIPTEYRELLHHYYSHDSDNAFPNAVELSHTTLSLPLYPALSDGEITHICGILQSLD